MTKPLLVRIPDELHARVKEESHTTGKSMAQIAADALDLYLNSVQLRLVQGDDNRLIFKILQEDAIEFMERTKNDT